MKTREWAREIAESESLVELMDLLDECESALSTEADKCGSDPMELAGVDTSDLPTFGGTEPADTLGIYSWDADSYLVQGPGSATWQIVDRY